MDEDGHPGPEDEFGPRIERIILDSHSARVSRALKNSQRNVQKWISGKEPAPQHAWDFLHEQEKLIGPVHPYAQISGILEGLLEKGVHPEVVASMLSYAYGEILDKSIR